MSRLAALAHAANLSPRIHCKGLNADRVDRMLEATLRGETIDRIVDAAGDAPFQDGFRLRKPVEDDAREFVRFVAQCRRVLAQREQALAAATADVQTLRAALERV
jgi:hypothetical protein